MALAIAHRLQQSLRFFLRHLTGLLFLLSLPVFVLFLLIGLRLFSFFVLLLLLVTFLFVVAVLLFALLILLLFDFVRSGDTLRGEWLFIEEDREFLNVDHLLLGLERETSSSRSGDEHRFSAPLLETQAQKIERFLRR